MQDGKECQSQHSWNAPFQSTPIHVLGTVKRVEMIPWFASFRLLENPAFLPEYRHLKRWDRKNEEPENGNYGREVNCVGSLPSNPMFNDI